MCPWRLPTKIVGRDEAGGGMYGFGVQLASDGDRRAYNGELA